MHNPDNWQFLVFSGKFSDNWVYFCEENNLGIPFAAYILLQNPNSTTPEYVKEILGGLGIILGGGYSLNKGLKDSQTRRYCKKYLTNLERLR